MREKHLFQALFFVSGRFGDPRLNFVVNLLSGDSQNNSGELAYMDYVGEKSDFLCQLVKYMSWTTCL